MTTKAAMILLLFFAVTFQAVMAFGEEPKKDERHYQRIWCDSEGGKMEYVLPDNTRVDCLTNSHAIEVDWARNWAEAVGQSMHYGLLGFKRAGIVLIIEREEDCRHFYKIENIIAEKCLAIDAWTIGGECNANQYQPQDTQ